MSRTDGILLTWQKKKEKWSANHACQEKAHQEAVQIVNVLHESIWCKETMREFIFGTQNLSQFQRKDAPNLKNVAVHLTKLDWQEKGQEFDLHAVKLEWELCLAGLQQDRNAAKSGREWLQAHHDAEVHQMWVSRKSREGDQTVTTLALQQEAHAFNIQTQGHIFGFTIKGMPLDYGAAQFFGDDVGEAFLCQVLGKSGEELAKEFEIFAIHGSQGVMLIYKLFLVIWS
ncbi:hypothetical protein DACRYDRAFT_89037 [Dacryopinax primogenitus]|uniref:Uncharacterized protein n=1 Tax=Dacryopinax primogenitus (strain DJM 731) TaxID=1858805 RepID=M5G818_DACPD|nr:uncharacterized protein DACRYDRAFT_89037 [Dacryopinax primogenitus]EJU02017.1 hypothetical protein DACRYDRAFT_89037 [Dacryopinax primogenitus]